MRCKVRFYAAGAALALGLSAGTASAQDTAQDDGSIMGPGCHFGEVLDGSTADDARRKIEMAGFSNVHALKKSCDNFWHGKATASGLPVNVVLSPTGKVILESE